MKNKKSRTLFDEEFRLAKLSAKNDPLERLNKNINWEIFRPVLNIALAKEPKGPGGRPPYDYILLFKILILQKYYNLSDEQAEYQILDRLSFMRFLGLTLSDNVPDCNTIWLFKENLSNNGAIEKLFISFEEQLGSMGLIVKEGSIVDASFVEAPRQRNSRQENREIKEGKVPENFKKNKHVMQHKDVDARWTKKKITKHFMVIKIM